MGKIMKIGTRDSKLAIWQAEFVKNEFKKVGIKSEIVFIKSEGDQNNITPLYEINIQGIFTRTLDIALLNGDIDIAVHSLKDVPTKQASGIILASIPKRGCHKDIFIHKGETIPNFDIKHTIGTSSLRRKAYWLHKYPHANIENLRGNIDGRLEKIEKNESWIGAIFAKTAIERLGLDIKNQFDLDFMLPAPAQGALGIACLEKNKDIIEICKNINDKETEICVNIERTFLNLLEGGCSMPIGALAKIKDEKIIFNGAFLSIDGKQKYDVIVEDLLENHDKIAKQAYEKLIKNKDAKKLIEDFKLSK